MRDSKNDFFAGLENSGKTTLLNILASGEVVQTAPTIGLNVKSFRKGGVNMKAWDIGGQQKFRDEWGRYTRGCDVIVFMVDASDRKKIDTARFVEPSPAPYSVILFEGMSCIGF